ncbi:MAG: hypothetical protein QQW96_10090 [Tychonema bourrellyi B0820]|nr:hypothetical protein [Tychonema bourrellyi]MDQ2097984.1 hypothetical protein [Tychonema bourrellyi B0820]
MKRISENNSQNSQNQVQKQPSPLVLALVLTGILVLEMYPALMHTAAAHAGALKNSLTNLESQEHPRVKQFLAAPVLEKISYSEFALNNLTSEPDNLNQGSRQNALNQLPASIIEAVRLDLSRQTGIAARRLRVTESSRQSWPNTCLGLAKSDELCGQMIVEGWRVVVSDGRQFWVYRTDARGKILRLEKKK